MAAKKSAKAAAVRSDIAALIAEVKGCIRSAQSRALLAVNAELVRLYWDIGRIITDRQRSEGWGTAVIPRLAAELKNELPDPKGFSERNIKRMLAFHRAYPDPAAIGQLQVAELPRAVAKSPEAAIAPQVAALSSNSLLWAIPWFHHVLLIEKVKDLPTRRWYMEQTLADGWSRNTLSRRIDSQSHSRHGKVVWNFAEVLPSPQSDLVQQTLKDP